MNILTASGLMNIPEAAEYLGVSAKTIRVYIDNGMYAQIGIGDTLHRDAKLGVVSIVRKGVAEDAARNH